MHVELTEKELLSCGLPMCGVFPPRNRMSVSSVLHRSCDSDPGVRSSGDCFDIQFSLLSAAALQSSGPLGSHALLVSSQPEHQSRKAC